MAKKLERKSNDKPAVVKSLSNLTGFDNEKLEAALKEAAGHAIAARDTAGEAKGPLKTTLAVLEQEQGFNQRAARIGIAILNMNDEDVRRDVCRSLRAMMDLPAFKVHDLVDAMEGA